MHFEKSEWHRAVLVSHCRRQRANATITTGAWIGDSLIKQSLVPFFSPSCIVIRMYTWRERPWTRLTDSIIMQNWNPPGVTPLRIRVAGLLIFLLLLDVFILWDDMFIWKIWYLINRCWMHESASAKYKVLTLIRALEKNDLAPMQQFSVNLIWKSAEVQGQHILVYKLVADYITRKVYQTTKTTLVVFVYGIFIKQDINI